MSFGSFVEGPLLQGAFLIFLAGIAARLSFFTSAILGSAGDRAPKWRYVLLSMVRALVPFHMGIRKKPVYASLRYIFHLCLFVLPIFLFEHIVLWEESRFGWGWTSLPGQWADRLTLLVLSLLLVLLLRRIILPGVRESSSLTDYFFLLVVSLPFLTGYFLSHGTPAFLSFLDQSMWTLHLLSGEALLISSAFLFCRTRLVEDKCTGCAACVLSCPTGTLEATDTGTNRVFRYSTYQCVTCGSCVGSCPEDAGELRHEINPRRFLPLPGKIQIRSVRLEACESCGSLFVPEPQVHKVLQTIVEAVPLLCLQCKKTRFSKVVSGGALSQA
jgi:NAD-dependent dihydropyrimidine dehydrogenase PreA subunit